MSIRVFNKPAVVIGGGASATLSSISISNNGTYHASNYGVDGFDVVDVAVGGVDSRFANLCARNFTQLTSEETYDVTNIGSYAFAYYNTLLSVDFPNVLQIGESAFYSCILLETAKFESCSFVGHYAFAYCSLLSDISFPNCSTISHYAFQNCSSLTSVEFTNVSIVGSYCLANCSELTSISFPNASLFNNGAFQYCIKLKDVYAPNLTKASAYCFNGCAALVSVSLSILTDEGSNAFAGCTSLEYVSIPSALRIASSCFSNCTSLKYIYAPKVSNIFRYGLSGCGFSKISLGQNVSAQSITLSIGAFASCTNLQKVLFLTPAYIIGQNCFLNCTKLESIYISGSIACPLAGITPFSNTPISNQALLGHYGSIYVLTGMKQYYVANTNWLAYSDRIVEITSAQMQDIVDHWDD